MVLKNCQILFNSSLGIKLHEESESDAVDAPNCKQCVIFKLFTQIESFHQKLAFPFEDVRGRKAIEKHLARCFAEFFKKPSIDNCGF